MILKSFFRKKTTKIYLFIFTFIFLAFNLIVIGRNYYAEKANESYDGSFIFWEQSKDATIPNVDGIKNVQNAIIIGNHNFIVADDNYKLNENEILINNDNKDAIDKIKNDFSSSYPMIDIDNFNFVFTDDNINNNFLIVNQNTFNKIVESDNNIVYIAQATDWINYEDVIYELNEEMNIEVNAYIPTTSANDYSSLYNTFDIFLYLVVILFFILSIISILNIINDEKNSNFLYKTLGYSKIKKLLITGFKILILLVSTVILSVVITFIIKVIFNI